MHEPHKTVYTDILLDPENPKRETHVLYMETEFGWSVRSADALTGAGTSGHTTRWADARPLCACPDLAALNRLFRLLTAGEHEPITIESLDRLTLAAEVG